jgi:FKBP-type peptidyl-prolyl cis-trans isomerase
VAQRQDKGQRSTATRGKPAPRRANGPRLHTGAAFTPHGIGSKRERLRAAAIARRRRTRRRRILIGVPVLVVVIALGVVGIILANQKPTITVTGVFGRAPKVTIPNIKPPGTLTVTDLIQGHGARVAHGDLAIVNLIGYSWSGAKHKQVISSFSSGQPQGLTIGQTIPGLDKSLAGSKVGSRLLLSIPPKDGFGSAGNQQLGVTGSDTLVFVVDVLGGYSKTAAAHGQPQPASDPKLPSVGTSAAGTAPPVTIPKAAPPGTLQAKTLIQGTGPLVAKGKLLVAHYEGLIWRNSKVFDSSWQRGAPTAFPIGTGKVIPGWDKSLVGQRIGSRVLLVIPPKDGYGAQGSSQAGIKGTDTLVFVVDILGTY